MNYFLVHQQLSLGTFASFKECDNSFLLMMIILLHSIKYDWVSLDE